MTTPPAGPKDWGNLSRRAVILAVGLFVMSIGVALTTRAGLGTTAISAPPYVLSLWGSWTFGMYTFAMLILLVVLQMALLRREYRPIQVIQLGAGAVFSAFLDLGMVLTNAFNPTTYLTQWVQVVVGSVVLGVGVALQVAPGLTYLPGDGTVVALAHVTKVRFDRMKIAFDTSLVVIAIIFSFVFWGELRGIREGTVVAAVLVGIVVGWVLPPLRSVLSQLGALPPRAEPAAA